MQKFKLYLYICVSAFFLILAVTLFYSFGYKYDFSTGKSFQTGAIVLKTVPSDATITKDGEEIKQSGLLGSIFSTFVKIENLETKSYNIKVSKDGYYDWQKNIEINAGQVGKFENIVLVKQNYTKQPAFANVTLSDSKNTWYAPAKNKIAFYGISQDVKDGASETKEGLFIIDLESKEQKFVLDKSQLALMGKIENVKWTDDDGKIIVKTSDNLYIVDLRDNNKAYLISGNIAKILNQNGAAFYIYDKFIVYQQDNAAYYFDYATKKTTKAIDGISSFCLYQGTLYFFKAGEIGGSSLSSASMSEILHEVLHETRISRMPQNYDPKKSFSVQKDNGNLLLLANDSLYLIDKDSKSEKINSNVKEARFFQSGKRILYLNDNEIWIYYVENKTSQPIKAQGENELLARFSSKLSNIYLYSDEEHIFFQESGSFDFTEFDGRDNRNTFKVLDNADGTPVFYVRGKSLIYIIKDGKLYEIDLKEE